MATAPRTVVIDYGMGNIHSVSKALEASGHRVLIADHMDASFLAFDPTHLVLPGVGAFGEGIGRLEKAGWIPALRRWISEDRPFLGICLGMQLLFGESHEFGTHRGLEIFPGRVVPFDPSRGKVPQIGWNEVKKTATHPIWQGLPPEPDLYFVHSFHVRTPERSIVLGETDYHETYPSMVGLSRVVAMQFHPEKSQRPGLTLLKNFGAL